MNNKETGPFVGVASLSSPLEVGADRAEEAVRQCTSILTDGGCNVISFGSITSAGEARNAGLKGVELHIEAIVFVPVCWYEDYYVLDFIEECSVPVLLWALPGMETGALCGIQQQSLFLKKLEHPYKAVFGELDDSGCLNKGMAFLRATALKTYMRRLRIGFAGQRVLGMTDTAVDEHMLKKALGPRVVPIPVPSLIEEARKIPELKVKQRWQEVRRAAGKTDVADKDGLYSVAVYFALKKFADEHGISAMTVGCYPDLMGIVCLSASLLADDGIPMACEGDVNGAAGMAMLSFLSGEPVHSTDWLDPTEDGSVVFTHCGSGSFSLAEKQEDIVLCPVRLMDRGVCAQFPAKPGPVTLVSLDPKPGGYRCALLEGDAVSTDMIFPGNPIRIHFKQKTEDIIDWIFSEGVAHHWMIGYGRFSEELRNWGEIVGDNLTISEPPGS